MIVLEKFRFGQPVTDMQMEPAWPCDTTIRLSWRRGDGMRQSIYTRDPRIIWCYISHLGVN